jgi:hypothetical protein
VSAPRRRKAPERSNARRKPATRDFWGKEDTADASADRIRSADDPTIMLRSLNSPPLPGRETVAVHYFAAVAEKAAALAVALAAASDLLDRDDEPAD